MNLNTAWSSGLGLISCLSNRKCLNPFAGDSPRRALFRVLRAEESWCCAEMAGSKIHSPATVPCQSTTESGCRCGVRTHACRVATLGDARRKTSETAGVRQASRRVGMRRARVRTPRASVSSTRGDSFTVSERAPASPWNFHLLSRAAGPGPTGSKTHLPATVPCQSTTESGCRCGVRTHACRVATLGDARRKNLGNCGCSPSIPTSRDAARTSAHATSFRLIHARGFVHGF
jgi:hypothetical protein